MHDGRMDGDAKRILVLGAPRSGTTVLKRYLASNTGCTLTRYPHTFDEIRAWCGDGMPVWKRTQWIEPASLSALVTAVPDSLFVLITRYPTDCLDSMRDLDVFRGRRTHRWVRAADDGDYVDWWYSIHKQALLHLTGLRAELVTYDQLIWDPVSVRRRVLMHVGISGDDSPKYDNDSFESEDEKCVAQSEVSGPTRPRRRRPDADRAYECISGGRAAVVQPRTIFDARYGIGERFEILDSLVKTLPEGNWLEVGSGASTRALAGALV